MTPESRNATTGETVVLHRNLQFDSRRLARLPSSDLRRTVLVLRACFTLSFALLAFIGCATRGGNENLASARPSFGPPKYCAGDTWRYSPGGGWIFKARSVLSADDNLVEMSGSSRCAGCRYYYNRNLILQRIERGDGTVVHPQTIDFWEGPDFEFWNFPLEVGKTWYFTTKRQGTATMMNWVEITVTVEALEDVQTQAGTFRAYRVRRDWHLNWVTFMNIPFTFYHRVWFAPHVKYFVKGTSSRPNEKDWELVSYWLACSQDKASG